MCAVRSRSFDSPRSLSLLKRESGGAGGSDEVNAREFRGVLELLELSYS